MANLVIPQGKEYTFQINVKEHDSFLAQPLGNMLTASAVFVNRATGCEALVVVPTVLDAINGLLTVTLTALQTATLVYERGSKVDGYYLKTVYQLHTTFTFSDIPEIFTILPEVYVTPTSCA